MKKRALYFAYLFLQILAITLIGIFTKGPVYSIVAADLSVLYVGLTAQGNRFGFCVGWGYALLYCYVCYTEGIYAMAAFLVLFLFPMHIVSFVNWGKNRKDNEVLVKKLTKKQILVYGSSMIAAAVVIAVVLKFTNGSQPVVDAVNFAFCAVTAVLILLRYYEMWIMSAACNLLGCILWAVAIWQGSSNFAILALNVFALANSIYGIFKWFKTRQKQLAAAELALCAAAAETGHGKENEEND